VASMCGWQGSLTCGGVCGCSGESALLGAVEKATAEAEKHGDRSSEKLSALVAEARGMLEQAKTEHAERAKAAAEAAAAAAAVKAAAEAEAAAERLQAEEEIAALTSRMQSDALRLQQMRARVGSSAVPAAHQDTEETMCVVCFDAAKDHLIVPCGHQCVCAGCAEQLTKTRTPTCPVCREPIQQTVKVFCS
jgi:Tfp pilus assembly protein FimV